MIQVVLGLTQQTCEQVKIGYQESSCCGAPAGAEASCFVEATSMASAVAEGKHKFELLQSYQYGSDLRTLSKDHVTPLTQALNNPFRASFLTRYKYDWYAKAFFPGDAENFINASKTFYDAMAATNHPLSRVEVFASNAGTFLTADRSRHAPQALETIYGAKNGLEGKSFLELESNYCFWPSLFTSLVGKTGFVRNFNSLAMHFYEFAAGGYALTAHHWSEYMAAYTKAAQLSGWPVTIMDYDDFDLYPPSLKITKGDTLDLDPVLMEKVFGADENGVLRKYDIIQNVVVFSRLVFHTLTETEIIGLLKGAHEQLNEDGFFVFMERLNPVAYDDFEGVRPQIQRLNDGTLKLRHDPVTGRSRPSYQEQKDGPVCFEKCLKTFNLPNEADGISTNPAIPYNITAEEAAFLVGTASPSDKEAFILAQARTISDPTSPQYSPYFGGYEAYAAEFTDTVTSEIYNDVVNYQPLNGRVASDVFEYYFAQLESRTGYKFTCETQEIRELGDVGYTIMYNRGTFASPEEYERNTWSVVYTKCTKA